MKKFILGVLTATLVFSLAASALAISGRMTIDVDPINIQVNGDTFVPKDVNGKEVPVFAYEGTTYAPLRALAEAYGLEVGYDAATNMATVANPDTKTEQPPANGPDQRTEDEVAYQEFKAMWKFVGSQASSLGNDVMAYMFKCDAIDDSELEQIRDGKYDYIDRMLIEYARQAGANSGDTVVGNFTNNTRGFFSTVDIP